MTIALGIMCSDGIVLGVDNQYSREHLKTTGQKLFGIPPGPNYKILVAGSGNADSVKKAVEVLEETLSDQLSDKPATLRELRDWIEAALAKVFRDHIDFAPEKQQEELHFDLLLAVHMNGKGIHLFRTNRTMVIPEKRRACIGTGLYLAEYVMDLILGPSPYLSIEDAKLIAVYTIRVAKDYIQYVGKQSIVHTLNADGTHARLGQSDIALIGKQFEFFFEGVRNSLGCLNIDAVSDSQIDPMLGILKRSIEMFREGERERRELKAKRLREIQTSQLNPQIDQR